MTLPIPKHIIEATEVIEDYLNYRHDRLKTNPNEDWLTTLQLFREALHAVELHEMAAKVSLMLKRGETPAAIIDQVRAAVGDFTPQSDQSEGVSSRG